MALVSLQEYKEYYNINSTTNDVRLSLLTELVGDLVESYIGRNILNDTYTNVLEENLNGYVYLDNFPIAYVDTLSYLSKETDAWVDMVATDYVIHADEGILEIVNPDVLARISSKHSRAIRATYEGGYNDTPSDLKLAIFDLLTYYYKREQTPSRSFNSQSVDTSAGLKGSEMPAHIKRVLALYRVPAG